MLAAAAFAPAARAATIQVTTDVDVSADDGDCSLREAADNAEANTAIWPDCEPGELAGDTIVLPAGVFTLTSINGAIGLDGQPAAGPVTLDGAGEGDSVIFQSQEDSVLLAAGRVTVSNVDVTGGHFHFGGAAGDDHTGAQGGGSTPGADATGGNGVPGTDGGGITAFNGTLTLDHVRVHANRAGDGGPGGSGLAGAGGDGTGAGGSGTGGNGGAGGRGGGVFTTGNLVVRDSSFSANQGGNGGGGGYGEGGLGASKSATCASCLAGPGGNGTGGTGGAGGAGGAIAALGSITIVRTTITGNVSGAGGGGGEGHGGGGGHGPPGATNPTGGAGGNGTGGTAGDAGDGAGILAGGPVTIVDSTISGNIAGTGGGGSQGAGGQGGNGAPTGGNGGPGGTGHGGNGRFGGDGGGIDALSSLTVSGSVFASDSAGAGNPGGEGSGGFGGNGVGAGNGGSGGTGQGGTGAPAGAGGGITARAAGSVRNVTAANNFVGRAGAGGEAFGGGGGNGGTSGGSGGNGGPATGGHGGVGGVGAGAYSSAPLQLVHTTVSSNSALQGGNGGAAHAGAGGSPGGAAGIPATAGIAGTSGVGGLRSDAPTMTLTNSIVAGNSPGNCAGNITDGGHDVTFPDASCPGTNADPVLGALADNGGPTSTEALGAGSAAVDAVPASGAACESADQRGVARPQGSACDAGAYENAPPAAVTGDATGIGSTSVTLQGTVTPFLRATSYRFEYGMTQAYGASTPAQDAGAANSPTAVAAGAGGLAPATTYHYRLVATNGDGTTTGADRTFTTAAALTAGSLADLIPPSFLAAAVNPATFVVDPRGKAETAVSAAKHKRGTRFTYTLSEAARVVFTIQRQASGRRVKGRCRKPTSSNRHTPRCIRYVGTRRFAVTAAAGAGSHRFSGRIGGHALPPGRYRTTLVATDAAGNRSKPRRLRFRVVRR